MSHFEIEKMAKLPKEFSLKISQLKQQLVNDKVNSVALVTENSLTFVIGLVSALSLDINVVILPNYEIGTLEKYQSHFDIIIDNNYVEMSSSLIKVVGEAIRIPFKSKITFYTSGSSGESLAVDKTFKNLFVEVETLDKTFPYDQSEVTFLSTVTHQHIYGFLFKILWPIITNKNVQFNLIKYPEELLNINKPFVLISSPAFLKRIYFSENVKVNNCLGVFSSGGLLPFESSTQCKKIFNVVPTEVYGSTETGGIAYRKNISGDEPWSLFCNVSLTSKGKDHIINSDYFNELELILSDRLELVDQRRFHLLGRKDRIVKVEEKRVSLDSIESYLSTLPDVSKSKAITLEINKRSKVAVVIVLSNQGQELLQSSGRLELKNKLIENLSRYYEPVTVPKYFRFVDEFEENLNGKVTYDYLRGLFDV